MKKVFVSLCLIFLAVAPLIAQIHLRESIDYDWDKNPVWSNIPADTSCHAIVMLAKYEYEYLYENHILYEYRTIHKKVKPLTSAGIESCNKVYIPVTNEDSRIIIIKARVINKDNSIKNLTEEDFKFAFDEETGVKYQYFAYEGIEPGSEVEYLYCQKKPGIHSGRGYSIQTEDTILEAKYSFITPLNLVLKFKAINGCPEIEKDTTLSDKRKWFVTIKNIPGLKEEDNAATDARRIGLMMKLDRNLSSGSRDIYSYGALATNVYDNVYNKLESKDEKLIQNLIEKIKPAGTNDEEKIRNIENYLKSSFIYTDVENEENSLIAKVLVNKKYNLIGALRLYAAIFKKLGIGTEIVGTSNRFERTFDNEFECYDLLDNYMLYFPSINKFMAPAENDSRLGFPDFRYINNYGLFIKGVSMGDYNTGVGKIKFISGAPYQDSEEILKINAAFNEDFSDVHYDFERQLNGYIADYYQSYLTFVKEEEKLKEFEESILNYVDKNAKLSNLTIENKGCNYIGQKPLIAKGTLNSDQFIEKAGNKLLFNVGLLIGPQVELYKKETRKLPVEFPYNHWYNRTITFQIPDKYKVMNLQDLNINEVYVRNGNDSTMGFTSTYEVNNNLVTVHITEYYKEYSYALSEFEEYRRVANAAANFNKIALIFEPK